MYEELKTTLKGKGLKIAHLNCRGVKSKLTEITLLLKTCCIDILSITESHLCDEILDENINIDNYRFLRQDRQNKSGGGCLIYYKENINVIPKPELTVGTIESIWFELIINSQRLLIGNVYRAPDNYEFYNHFKTNLERIWLKRNNVNNAENYHGRKLQGITKSFSLINVITEPTRIAENSETLLDLILVSNESKILKAGTFDPAISDHKLIYTIVNLNRRREKPVMKTVRNYKLVNKENFKLALQNAPWWIGNLFDDIDDVVNTWELLYKDVVDEFITERNVKLRQNSLPWVNNIIIIII